jgi:hypothetical protein
VVVKQAAFVVVPTARDHYPLECVEVLVEADLGMHRSNSAALERLALQLPKINMIAR